MEREEINKSDRARFTHKIYLRENWAMPDVVWKSTRTDGETDLPQSVRFSPDLSTSPQSSVIPADSQFLRQFKSKPTSYNNDVLLQCNLSPQSCSSLIFLHTHSHSTLSLKVIQLCAQHVSIWGAKGKKARIRISLCPYKHVLPCREELLLQGLHKYFALSFHWIKLQTEVLK